MSCNCVDYRVYCENFRLQCSGLVEAIATILNLGLYYSTLPCYQTATYMWSLVPIDFEL